MSISRFASTSRSISIAVAVLGLAFSLNSHATAGKEDLQALYKQAIASPLRTDDDRAADSKRKPLELLNFAQARPGMRVLDVATGTGYTTQLLALVVGREGAVWAQAPEVNEKLISRVAKNPDHNIYAVALPYDDPVPKEANKLDLVTLIMNYHDIAYLSVDREQMNKRLFDALKPGGHLVVLDHSAKEGHGTDDAKTLHRIDEKVVMDEIQKAGFKLEQEGDFMKNPNDPRDQPFFKTDIPTDKFALRFVKP